jgi:hypothetical protein
VLFNIVQRGKPFIAKNTIIGFILVQGRKPFMIWNCSCFTLLVQGGKPFMLRFRSRKFFSWRREIVHAKNQFMLYFLVQRGKPFIPRIGSSVFLVQGRKPSMPRIRSLFFFCFKKENNHGNNLFVFIFLVQRGKSFKITICSCFTF